MLKAIDKKTQKYVLSFKDKINKINEYICPVCNEKLIFVDAIWKIKHFRHYIESFCEPEPETERHLEMKLFLMKKLNLKKENVEVNLKFAIPDLFLPKRKIAIETQHSPLSYAEFIERTKRYSENNIYVLWIFDISLLSQEVSKVLQKAHQFYFGRVYFYDNEYITPIHFQRYARWVKEYFIPEIEDYIGGYWAYYKNRRNLIYNYPILKFEISRCINDWDNIKIAKFCDKKFWEDGKPTKKE